MNIVTGKFDNPQSHHTGWFKVFRGNGILEVWLGARWCLMNWR